MQDIPAPVAFVDHDFKLAGSVGAVLSGQAAVLVVDQLQLGQPLVYLSLEALRGPNEGSSAQNFDKPMSLCIYFFLRNKISHSGFDSADLELLELLLGDGVEDAG